MQDDVTLGPLGDTDWPPEIADMRDGFAGGLNVYRTMAHHPALLRAWADLRAHIVTRTALGADRAEVVVLRTGARLGSSYEWSQHILRARKAGLSDARIAAMRGSPDNMCAADATLARAVDDLLDNARIGTATRQMLHAQVGTAGVFDLIATVGFYATLGYILNTFDTPLDDDIAAELAANPLKK